MEEIKIMNQIDQKTLKHLNRMKQALHGAVGKTDSAGNYLPLWLHLTDVAVMIEYLYDHRLSDSQKSFLLQELEDQTTTNPEQLLRQTLKLLGYLHDIAKLSSVFQALMEKGLTKSHFSLPVFPYFQYMEGSWRHHAASGMLVLSRLGYRFNFSSLVGAHHGTTQKRKWRENMDRDEIVEELDAQLFSAEGRQNLFGQDVDSYCQSWKEVSDILLDLCGFSKPEEVPVFSIPALVILSGLLIEADWMGSSTTYFPLFPEQEDPDPVVVENRKKTALEKLDLPSVWHRDIHEMDEAMFQSMFNYWPNPVQKGVMQIENEAIQPGLLIIEAQMGLGKTEAALAATDILAGKVGSGGVYFGLPTQATANGLFPRFRHWSSENANESGNTFKLAHGMAGFNEAYQKMPHCHVYGNEDGEGKNEESVFVHEWMQNPKTGTLSDFVLGTVDQALLMALNHRHFMLRHLGLSGKVVIIDEVHAYDAYMNVFFCDMLEWLGRYHTPVILLSATLPEDRKKSMVESYLKGRIGKLKGLDPSWNDVRGYPLLTWTDGNEVHAKAIETSDKNSMTVKITKVQTSQEDRAGEVALLLQDRLANGGCAGVVVNEVAVAQDLAHYLEEQLPNYRIILFHSRYLAEDRAKIEAKVLELVGKKSTSKQRDRLVIVGTQVIEQSLDVDFDVMISMLAPMDLLLQRMGRLHRHKERNARPKNLAIPEFITLIPSDEELKRKRVYQPWYLVQTKKALPERVRIPQDIPELVRKVYGEQEPESDLEKGMYREKEEFLHMQKNKAMTVELKKPKDREPVKTSLNGLMDSNSVEKEEIAVESVRDIGPSLEVLLLKKNQGQSVLIENEGQMRRIELDQPLNEKDRRLVMQTRLSIPFSHESEIEEIKKEISKSNLETFKVWRQDPLMNQNLLVLMDEYGRFVLDDKIYNYSERYGLEKNN